MPGERYVAHANVCTFALPFELLLPPPEPVARVPWNPMTQQLKMFGPMCSRTSSVR